MNIELQPHNRADNPRQIVFTTPENVDVSFELAGIGSRFLAVAIDHLLQILAIIGLTLVAGIFSQAFSVTHLFGGGSLWAEAAVTLGSFVIMMGYFVFFELKWSGQSPGKRLLGLRVVRDGAYPIDPYSSAVRNLVRLVDFALPPPYGAGLISIFFTKHYKRLGDIAAGTIVIKVRPTTQVNQGTAHSMTLLAREYMAALPNIDGVTFEQFHAIQLYLRRRSEFPMHMQVDYAMRLALPIMAYLQLPFTVPYPEHFISVLEAIEYRYIEERRLTEFTI